MQANPTAPRNKARLSLGPMMAASLIFIVLTWLAIATDAENVIAALAETSSSVKLYAKNQQLLLFIGFIGSLMAVMITSALMVRSLQIFMAIWLFTLSIAEAQIPILQQISLVLRYSMMVSLFLAGLFYLFAPTYRLSAVQKIGLAVVALIALQTVVNPMDTNAMLSVPMQLTMFIGVIIGLAGQVEYKSIGRKIAYSLVAASIACVIINALALVAMPEPFLGGRFRSWYSLPTNFSNIFVLCITPLMWGLIDAKRPVVKACLLIFLVIGIVLILLSGTRNALLVLTLSMLLMTFFWKRRYFAYVVVAGMLVGLAAVALNFTLADLGHAGSRIGHVSDRETRFFVWERALMYIFERPLLGYGLSADLRTLDHNLPVWEQFNAHNALLGLWLREGVFGMVLHIIMYFISLITAFFVLLKRKNTEKELAVLALFFCSLMGLWTAGLFEENLTSRASLQQAFWALSIVMISYEVKQLRIASRIRREQRNILLQQRRDALRAPAPTTPTSFPGAAL